MNIEKAQSAETVCSAMVCNGGADAKVRGGGVFHAECYDKNGNLKWSVSSHNLVVNEGLQDMNTQYFKGSTYSAAFYLGLITGPGSGTSYSAGDTLATHGGWTEFTNYSGSRKAVTFGTASTADPSVISNSASPASFTITGAGGVVAGAFLATVASGTSGVLFSEADFQSPGDRTVVSGDTLNVTYTFNLDAA
jgi:hypothetical protein